jgi:uncharacterized protein
MRFFDCNTYFGLPCRRPLAPVPEVGGLLAAMEHDGVEKALVWHVVQRDASVQAGNQLLAEAIRPHTQLSGCWTLLPPQTHELPSIPEFFRQMQASRVVALRVFPSLHNYLMNGLTMGAWLDEMTSRRIPLLVSIRHGIDWACICTLMSEFPKLVCVVCDHGVWGSDRLFRPLLEHFPNLYIETSDYILDGGIEAFVSDYGAGRMLFGSGFPDSYFGGMMLAIKHARIPDDAKTAIASGNLERILGEVQL